MEANSTPAWVPREPRYRRRLLLGLSLLCLAAVATAWLVWGACSGRLPGSAPEGADPPGLGDLVRLGMRSVIAVILCAGVFACAARPIRRARADYARLATAQIMLAGLLLAGVVLAYWLFWSPLSFLK